MRKPTNIRLVSERTPSPEEPKGGQGAALVREAQKGDVEAFEALIASHQQALFGFCVAMLKDLDEGADAAQDSLVKAFRRIATYRFEAPFRTWLFQIARHTCQDRLRSHQRKARHMRNLVQQADVARHDRSPEDQAHGNRVTDLVREALAAVPEPYREAVILFDLQGWSYPEIAELCGVAVGTVKSRIARGREALRKVLSERRAFDEMRGQQAPHKDGSPARGSGKGRSRGGNHEL